MSSRLFTSRTEACRILGGEEETQGLPGSNVTEDNKGRGGDGMAAEAGRRKGKKQDKKAGKNKWQKIRQRRSERMETAGADREKKKQKTTLFFV